MNNEPVATVPFYVFEASEERSDRRISKLMISIVILTGAFLASNMAWLCAFLWRL